MVAEDLKEYKLLRLRQVRKPHLPMHRQQNASPPLGLYSPAFEPNPVHFLLFLEVLAYVPLGYHVYIIYFLI